MITWPQTSAVPPFLYVLAFLSTKNNCSRCFRNSLEWISSCSKKNCFKVCKCIDSPPADTTASMRRVCTSCGSGNAAPPPSTNPDKLHVDEKAGASIRFETCAKLDVLYPNNRPDLIRHKIILNMIAFAESGCCADCKTRGCFALQLAGR